MFSVNGLQTLVRGFPLNYFTFQLMYMETGLLASLCLWCVHISIHNVKWKFDMIKSLGIILNFRFILSGEWRIPQNLRGKLTNILMLPNAFLVLSPKGMLRKGRKV